MKVLKSGEYTHYIGDNLLHLTIYNSFNFNPHKRFILIRIYFKGLYRSLYYSPTHITISLGRGLMFNHRRNISLREAKSILLNSILNET